MDEILEKAEDRGSTVSTSNINNADGEAEYVYLPSKGVFYKGKFKGLDKLKVRKLDYTDEDILTTKSYYDNNTLFDEILKNTIVDENGFKAEDLVPIDRDTIIWWLRIGSFGSEYQIPYTCTNPKCKVKTNIIWDLSDFDMPDLPIEVEEEIVETGGILITLPLSKLKCKITVASIGKELKVHKFLTKRKETVNKKNPSLNITKEFTITGRLLAAIEKVYDISGKEYSGIDETINWLNSAYNGKPLPIIDSRYIIKKIKEITMEVNTKKDIECPSCNHIEEGVRMPMSIYFFWPEFEELSGVSNKIN